MPDVAMSAACLERCSGLVAAALSSGSRQGARIVSGETREFGVSRSRSLVEIPYPALDPSWTLRTYTCGVVLQCAPSKERLAPFALDELTTRESKALSVVEGRVALGWMSRNWAGLSDECARHLDGLTPIGEELDGSEMIDAAMELARSGEVLPQYPLLGRLSATTRPRSRLAASMVRMAGRVPWGSKRNHTKIGFTIPVAGEGGVRNPNMPPPSRPGEDEVEIRADQRVGIPYPEWNAWTESFLPRHVAVLERKLTTGAQAPQPISPAVRRWFEEHTHRTMRRGLEDGSDLDIERYVQHYVDALSGHASDGLVFRDLLPGFRDVTTALLLDGSSSLGIGHIFPLELACADALSQAMKLAHERHGVFVFNGKTRHRVDVRCLKDFNDPQLVVPSKLGLVTGGYTRLGAPIRHLTSRLLQQQSERRLLIIIGDGLMSDDGYEGKYAWADVAHAVEEASDAGVTVYYIGVGPVRIDPLPEVFGPRRSRRIRRVDDLPNVLAQAHRELVSA
ncbi:VWA domain-containing protein [Mycobacterium syngnathidarum]